MRNNVVYKIMNKNMFLINFQDIGKESTLSITHG